MKYKNLSVDTSDGLATVTMRRAARRNSLSWEHLAELRSAFESIAGSDARGILLAAEGPVFCSGHDFNDMHARDLDGMRELLASCAEFMQLLLEIPQPVVAQVQGPAIGAGCQLVASCDLAVAGKSASFQTPGGQSGWFCHTPAVAVVRAIGRKRALEMLFTGDAVDPETAVEWGLVNHVVADESLAVESLALLQRATRGSRVSKGEGKRAFYRQADLDVAGAYELASDVMAMTSQSRDGQENISAFVEKRAAKYDDRSS